MRRNFIYSAVCLGLLSLTSCATIFTGTTIRLLLIRSQRGQKFIIRGMRNVLLLVHLM